MTATVGPGAAPTAAEKTSRGPSSLARMATAATAALLPCAVAACARPPVQAANAPVGEVSPRDAATEVPPRLLFDQTSAFGRVLVLDEGPRRVMRFGSPQGSEQSEIVRDDPRALPVEYVRYALLGLAHQGPAGRVLMVGLGGGTFSNLIHRALPDVTVDVVEIDPVVVAAARAYFGVAAQEDARYRVHVADAAAWIGRDDGRYDYILLDAYAGEAIPLALRGVDFFRAVGRRLAPGGVVAINIAELHAEGLAAAGAFRSVFQPFDCYQAPHDGNIVIFAATGSRPAAGTEEAAAAARRRAWLEAWDARGFTDFSLRALAATAGGPDCDEALGTNLARRKAG
jgi:spermidine synthase